MTTRAIGSTAPCHRSCPPEMPSSASPLDAWVVEARVFATRTVELRRLHGGGEIGKLLMALVRAINVALRAERENMENKTIMVSAAKMREILTERDRMLAQMETLKGLLESIGPDGLKG